MFDQKLFGRRIKELRINKNLKQEDLGQMIGVSNVQISFLESGKKLTNIISLIALSECFNVSTDYLLGLTDNPRRH